MIHIFFLILSFAVLLWGSHLLVRGAAGIAAHYNMPALLIGFTIVALGTSLPEIVIAIDASLSGFSDIAIGNTIGTNIANIGFVLGLTALIKPLKVQPTLLRREYPLLFLVMLFSYSLMLDGYFGILDSCLFLLACLAFITYLIVNVRSYVTIAVNQRFQQNFLRNQSRNLHIICLLVGIILLSLGSYFLIKNAVLLAHHLGVSDLIIALTIVAFGSSLPDLITSIVAIKVGADEIAIGNILGANIFNLLAVLIAPGLIHPAVISHAILWRDIPFMFAATLILLWFNSRGKKRMTRWHGGLLVLLYCCYIIALFISAMR